MSSSFIRRGATIAVTSTVTLGLVAAGLAAPAQAIIESDNVGSVVGYGYEGDENYNWKSISNLPVAVGDHEVKDIAAGNLQSYILTEDDNVVSTSASGYYNVWTLTEQLNGRSIVDLEAGYSGTFALLSDGSLISESPNAPYGASAGFTAATQGKQFTQVSAGRHYAIAIRDDTTITTWGTNPVGGTELTDVELIDAGYGYGLALTGDGVVHGFGDNGWDQSSDAAAAAAIDGGDVVGLAAGQTVSSALLDDGSVVAWGNHGSDYTTAIAEALGSHKAVAIESIYSEIYVTADDGRVLAFDLNENTAGTIVEDVEALTAGHRVAQVVSGEFHTLFALEDPTVSFSAGGDSLDDVTVTTADSIDLDATGFLGDVDYTISWDGTVATSGTTPASGVISLDVDVPDTLAAGIHTVVLTVDGQSFDASVTVSAGLTAPTPTISGTKKVGSELTAVKGKWTAGTTFAYSWLRNGKAISGATSSKYTLTPTDLGKTLQVKVTGTKSGSAAVSKTSAKTAKIAAGAIVKGWVEIYGNTQVGRTVTADTGDWASNVTLSYQWYANNKAISKATKKTYVIPAGLVDKTLSVRVNASAAGYVSTSSYAVSSWFVDRGYIDLGSYYLTGSPAVGKTLTITRDAASTETASVTRTYQWFVNGEPVQGATKSTFKLTSRHVGKYVDARVYIARAGYYPDYNSVWGGQVFEKSVTPGKVALTGTAKVGNVLSATVSAVPAGVEYDILWYKKNGSTVTEINGTYGQSTYTVQAADKGYQIYNEVYFYKSGFAYVLVKTPLTKKVV